MKESTVRCDGSMHTGKVRILGHTYVGSIHHTTSRIFYAMSVAEGMMIYGANIINAFGVVPPSAQGLHILPDKSFHDW